MAELVAGRFELIDQIGSGGVGSVWRAYDRKERRYCAAKLARQQRSAVMLRVLREQGVRLAHPHVLSPYAWAAEDDVVLVASDLMHGGSLVDLIRDNGALPWRYAAEILGQVLDALAHVHAADLVHRDLKPANVLLEATGRGAPHVRLADFGIAYQVDGPRLTETGFVIGTPGYLAPEVLAGRGPHPSQDLFAAGVLAWQLLTGYEHPEERTGDAAPTGVPDLMWTVVRALLEPDPLRRPADAAAARRMLAPVLAAEPLRLPAISPAGEPIEVFDVLPGLPDRRPVPSLTRRLPRPPAGRPGVRRWLAGAGVLVLASATVLGLIRLGDREGSTESPDPPGSTAPSRPPRPEVVVGGSCQWQDVAAAETAADGTPVRCVQQPDGGYTWQPA